MTKNEFLEQLKLALSGEVPDQEIINQVNYYDNYIRTQKKHKREEQVIEELGSPNIIAKTIIDAYKRAHGSDYKSRSGRYFKEEWDSSGYKTYNYDNDLGSGSASYNDRTQKNNTYGVPWYVKLLAVVFIALIFALIILLGTIFIRILIYLIPIFLIIFLVIIIFRIIKS